MGLAKLLTWYMVAGLRTMSRTAVSKIWAKRVPRMRKNISSSICVILALPAMVAKVSVYS